MFNEALKNIRNNYPDFFKDILIFNFYPASYIHDSRKSEFINFENSDYLWSNRRSIEYLSSRILAKLNLTNKYIFKFPDKYWAVALLSKNKLERLASHIGAIVIGSKIRESISREQVIYWKDLLGTDLYRFVLTSGKLIKSIEKFENGVPLTSVQNIGYSLILKSLANAGEELTLRVKLKMPSEIPDFSDSTINPYSILHKVLNILESEWLSLFEIKSR